MFRKFFKKTTAPAHNRNQITLNLTFVDFEPDNAGITVAWQAQDAPSDIMFDVDFLGIPSGVTTGFVWDNDAKTLNNIFTMAGDTSFKLQAGWAYADTAMDGSGHVGAVWVLDTASNPVLTFDKGSTLSVSFVFDPHQKKIRTPD